MVRVHSRADSNPKQAGERRGYVALTGQAICHEANPPVKQNSGLQGRLPIDGFRKPRSTTLQFDEWTGGNPM
jgi:hypothetical protein